MNTRETGQAYCPLLESMREHKLQASRRASVNRIAASFDLFSREGFGSLNTSQFHLANKQHHIYEFIGGDLRVMFFKADSGKIVICTHMMVKSGNKASKSDVDYAIKCAKLYKKAELAGTIVWQTTYNG